MLPSEPGSVPRTPPEGKRSDQPPLQPGSLILRLEGGSIQASRGGSILASAEELFVSIAFWWLAERTWQTVQGCTRALFNRVALPHG